MVAPMVPSLLPAGAFPALTAVLAPALTLLVAAVILGLLAVVGRLVEDRGRGGVPAGVSRPVRPARQGRLAA
jgi:hypothetical protein